MRPTRARTAFGLRLLFDPRVQLVLALTALAVVAVVRFGQLVYSAESAAQPIGFDFAAYWSAARHVLDAEPIYSAAQLEGGYPSQVFLLYLYPPLLAILVTPLAAIFSASYVTAAWVWAALGVLMMAASVVGLARLQGWSWRHSIALLAAALALPPVALELYMGNVHLLLLGLLAVAWLGVLRNDARGDASAGIAIAAASLIKVFPVLLIGWLLLIGRYRAALVAGVAVAALVLLSLPIVGLDAWLAYPTVLANLQPPATNSGVLAPTMWLAEVVGFGVARVVVTALGVAAIVWSARRQPLAVSFSVAVLVSLLVVPALYVHYLGLAVLVLLVYYAAGARRRATLAYAVLFGGTQLVLLAPADDALRAIASLAVLFVLGVLLSGPYQAAVRDGKDRLATAAAPSS